MSQSKVSIRPLQDRIIVVRDEAEQKTQGGIVIPDTASKDKPVLGTVVAVGAGKILDNGDVRALEVKVGDKVLFGKYAGTEVKYNAADYVVMREEDIMGVVS